MSEPAPEKSSFDDLNRADAQSALFAQLVMQQSNMAFMLMGRVPHPETKETVRDLDSARLFIDQLEMLQTKTAGNLRKEEDAFLKQTLMSLHLAFVEALGSPPAESKKTEAAAPEAAPQNKTAPATEAGAEADEKTKFSKKYSL
jgi:hypothetical protein